MWKAGGVHLLEIPFPKIDPVAFAIGPLKVHWYGLMYLLAFVIAYLLMRRRLRQQPYASIRTPKPWEKSDIEDLLMYAIAGVIVGGRLGYVLFYNLDRYLSNPVEIVQVWDGGMSFHGGAIGVVLGMWFFAWRRKRPFLQVADFLVPTVPLGLAAGRVGNFINGELWGRIAPDSLPWAMRFPTGGDIPRHPSQIYQALLEGVLLFIILWIYARKPRLRGQVAAVFLMGYGILRGIAEYWRQPDEHIGTLFLGLSMGQWLSVPMIVAGAALWLWANSRGVTDLELDESDTTEDEDDELELEAEPEPVDEEADEAVEELGEEPVEEVDEPAEPDPAEETTPLAEGGEPVDETVDDVENHEEEDVNPAPKGDDA
ncbi:prolipoprotein diacylglyceryl transferase [Arachnia propionica]|uniref:Phosphatidylglycerol--prolipoprotein diacylglyceryl transferase n=1 Tax=Arachnia propionica TaxID=1750 RepID=A0A3P1WP42_9ACTN|nr:prolipoprotein diacylglyceryl transferase [Arachnia propionica]RRD48101.1 prolipoprotein diacylglyceryl transferase [Arachnia propionica]